VKLKPEASTMADERREPLTLPPQMLPAFEFHDQQVRTMLRDGEPWFVLADVCAVLDIANSRDAASRLDDEDKGVASADTPGGRQQAAIVSEAGLYALIFTSRKPEARTFKRWVTSIVLPAIRRTGSYAPAGVTVPRSLPEALRLAADQAERADAIREELAIAAPKAAFADRYADSSGTHSFRQVAKLLGANESRFRAFLEAKGILYRLGDNWTAKAAHIDAGRLVVKAGTSPTGHAFTQARFTAKGVRWIAGLWGQHELATNGASWP
jgi:anti-repressor protein